MSEANHMFMKWRFHGDLECLQMCHNTFKQARRHGGGGGGHFYIFEAGKNVSESAPPPPPLRSASFSVLARRISGLAQQYSLNKKEWICSLFKEWILEKSEIQ